MSGDTDQKGPSDALSDIGRHGIGMAHVAADFVMLDCVGAASDWLPAPGRCCFEAPALAGMEGELRALRERALPVLALPNIGMGASGDKATITIAWDAASDRYSIATARAFGASETELMLVRERRERRLVDEQAEAARRRANINEALYRDIVDQPRSFTTRSAAPMPKWSLKSPANSPMVRP